MKCTPWGILTTLCSTRIPISISQVLYLDPKLYTNTCIADWFTLLSAPFSNCSATYVVLNFMQHVALHDLIANVEDIPHLASLIPAALPSVINQRKWAYQPSPCLMTHAKLLPPSLSPSAPIMPSPTTLPHFSTTTTSSTMITTPCSSPQTSCHVKNPVPLPQLLPLFSKPGVETALDLTCPKKWEESFRKLKEPQDTFHKISRIKGNHSA